MSQTEYKPKKRTPEQNKALHLWLRQKAKQCRDAGVTTQMAFNKTVELEMTEETMKAIWREIQKAMFKKASTTELEKSSGQIDEIYEHMNRFFSENFNLPGIEFPHDPNKISNSPGYRDNT